MNLPNKLTMIRIFITPVIVIVFLLNKQLDSVLANLGLYIMGLLFIIASFTDFLDGNIARKRNIVTTFGKFIDPLADKLLVTTTLLLLTIYYYTNLNGLYMWMPFWVVLIIITRDLIVTSIRLVSMNEGTVVAAHFSGKIKTALLMVTISYYFFIMPFGGQVISIIGTVMTILCVLLTIYSAVDYFLRSKNFILKEI